jgi:protoporphyrinogen oxidase
MYDVIIVGGGIAGLTAAYSLHQAGLNILIMESQSYPGGRIRTVAYGDLYAEAGASVITASESAALDLMLELGIEEKIELGDHGVELFLNGRFLRLSRIDGRIQNFRDALSVFRLGMATAARRDGFLPRPSPRLFVAYRHALAAIQAESKMIKFPYDPQARQQWDSETFAEFLNRFHPSLSQYIDLQLKVTAGELSKRISLFWGLVTFHWNVDARFYWLRGGTSMLPNTLARRLESHLRMDSHVDRIFFSKSSGVGRVRFCSGGRTFEEQSKAVIVATPPDSVLKLVEEIEPRKRQALESVRFGAYIVVHLVCRRRFWEQKIKTGYLNCAGVVFADLLDSTKEQTGHTGILACFLAGPEAQAYAEASEEVIMQAVQDSLDRVFPLWRLELLEWRLFRWPRAIPYFPPHYGRHLQELRRGQNNIFFCGDYTQGAGINDAILSGQIAAKSTFEYISGR